MTTPRTVAYTLIPPPVDQHEAMERAIDYALPPDGTVRRMHQRGGLAVRIAEYGRVREEPIRAERNHYLAGCPCPQREACVPHGWSGPGPYSEHHGTCADHGHVDLSAPPPAPVVVPTRERLEGVSRALHGHCHDGDDTTWATCELEPCVGARDTLARDIP